MKADLTAEVNFIKEIERKGLYPLPKITGRALARKFGCTPEEGVTIVRNYFSNSKFRRHYKIHIGGE